MNIQKYILFLLFLYPVLFNAQTNEQPKKLSFTGDFRFRAEQDWNSQKSDGSYRNDRSRFRYRARFGMKYQYNDWASFGFRIRTGYREKQQDPHLTLGDGFGEFSTIPVGFEKLFFKVNYKWLEAWAGKNTFPFEKQDELFWSDNVYPEGLYAAAKFNFDSALIESLKLSAAHFVIRSSGNSFNKDEYLQVFQALSTHWDNRLKIYPAFYYFNELPDIPDGNENFYLNYAIMQLGTKIVILQKPYITFGLDYYHNFEDYQEYEQISERFRDQRTGFVSSVGWGKFSKKGDWMIKLFYTHLEKYAAVDFLAQNDWVRWDYSSQGSPDGRLTNFKGTELRAGYKVGKKFTLILRYFMVDQIIPHGDFSETGNRIRLDLNIGF
jgi:hypothetical protein